MKFGRFSFHNILPALSEITERCMKNINLFVHSWAIFFISYVLVRLVFLKKTKKKQKKTLKLKKQNIELGSIVLLAN